MGAATLDGRLSVAHEGFEKKEYPYAPVSPITILSELDVMVE